MALIRPPFAISIVALLISASIVPATSDDTSTVTAPHQTSYENYAVFDIEPTTDEQTALLTNLERENDASDYMILQSSRQADRPWRVVIAPSQLDTFQRKLTDANITYTIEMDNLQTAIDAEQVLSSRADDFGWSGYHDLSKIYAWLDDITANYQQYVQQIIIGKTYENRQIRGVHISFGDPKPGVFIEGGIHAREWISPAFVTYLINELLTSTDGDVRRMAESHDWYIVPVMNPDGYVYSHEYNRLWRKTRSPQGGRCVGVDPNRNWNNHWAELGNAPYPCSDVFAGKEPFSEIEIRDYATYLRGLGDKISALITFHSFSQLLIYPYGYKAEPPKNAKDLKAIGAAATEALAKRFGTQYKSGSIHDTIYAVSGSSLDYAHDQLGLRLAFGYELRPDEGRAGFELPAEQIVQVGQETVDSLVALFDKADALGYFGTKTGDAAGSGAGTFVALEMVLGVCTLAWILTIV